MKCLIEGDLTDVTPYKDTILRIDPNARFFRLVTGLFAVMEISSFHDLLRLHNKLQVEITNWESDPVIDYFLRVNVHTVPRCKRLLKSIVAKVTIMDKIFTENYSSECW